MATRIGRFLAAFPGLLLASPIAAQATQRVTVTSAGVEGNGYTSSAAVSADGRFVAFSSQSTNLVAADTNAEEDIFLRDRQLGTTRRMSLAWDGAQANSYSRNAAISADGSLVGFTSAASNLVPADGNAMLDVFVRDRLADTTELVSVALGGGPGNGHSAGPILSADGRFVLFESSASDLVPGDTNGSTDVFLRDRQTGTTERVSLTWSGAQSSSSSSRSSISADGRYVVFNSGGSGFVMGDTNTAFDVFVRDRQAGTTERASVDSDEVQGNSGSNLGRITSDGRYVAFTSTAFNLVRGDTNHKADVFVRDRVSGTTERVSLNSGEGEGNFECRGGISISADGRYVAFQSKAQNMVAGDTNNEDDVFLRDRILGTTERVSVDGGGAQANEESGDPTLSEDGRWIVFLSPATNLVSGDANLQWDVFLRDRDATAFSSMCDSAVIACPCANPPSGPTKGCDNSSATGGAVLAASGVTHLSADSLVFTTSGEKPTALSIVLQGTVFLSSGVVYGQGVRCVGGSLKRLYAKSAVGGSITAPDFGAGDASVSARSAAKGDVIQPGQPRWYMVYYRDNTVLGGCPSSSTFNTTQTGMVSWTP